MLSTMEPMPIAVLASWLLTDGETMTETDRTIRVPTDKLAKAGEFTEKQRIAAASVFREAMKTIWKVGPKLLAKAVSSLPNAGSCSEAAINSFGRKAPKTATWRYNAACEIIGISTSDSYRGKCTKIAPVRPNRDDVGTDPKLPVKPTISPRLLALAEQLSGTEFETDAIDSLERYVSLKEPTPKSRVNGKSLL